MPKADLAWPDPAAIAANKQNAEQARQQAKRTLEYCKAGQKAAAEQ